MPLSFSMLSIEMEDLYTYWFIGRNIQFKGKVILSSFYWLVPKGKWTVRNGLILNSCHKFSSLKYISISFCSTLYFSHNFGYSKEIENLNEHKVPRNDFIF